MNISTKLLSSALLASAALSMTATEPTTPPVISWDPADVGVIYASDQDTFFDVMKDSQGNAANAWNQPVWGQTCVVSDDECGDGAAIRIDNLDFLPLQFLATLNLSDFRFLHLDLWVSSDCLLDFTLQNWWPGDKFVTEIYSLKTGEWNSIDIDMAALAWGMKNGAQERVVNVLKLAGENVDEEKNPYAETIFMTNVMAHNDESVLAGINDVVVTEAPEGDGITYDLFGRRVGEGYKGIAIRNGQKFILK